MIPRPSSRARFKAWGFVVLWVAEWGMNLVQLGLFFLRRRRIRRWMRELIVTSRVAADTPSTSTAAVRGATPDASLAQDSHRTSR